MDYNRHNYIGKNIQLYPGDTYPKYGTIVNVDDLGWTIKITSSRCDSYTVGATHFISHSYGFSFRFV